MTSNKITKTIIIVALTASAFFIGSYSVDKNSIEKNGYDVGYSTGYESAWNEAKTIVDSSTIFPKKPEEIYLISGIIKNISISNSLILIEAGPVSSNPLSEDSKITERTIKITSSTELVESTPKSLDIIQEEMQNGGGFNPYFENEINFDQFKVGDIISVSSDKDIKRETEFTADKITLIR